MNRLGYSERMEKVVRDLQFGLEQGSLDVAKATLAHYKTRMVDIGIIADKLSNIENERDELKQRLEALEEAKPTTDTQPA